MGDLSIYCLPSDYLRGKETSAHKGMPHKAVIFKFVYAGTVDDPFRQFVPGVPNGALVLAASVCGSCWCVRLDLGGQFSGSHFRSSVQNQVNDNII